MVAYTGITGFMNNAEVLAVLDTVPEDSERMLMIGVLASSETIKGISNSRPRRYPKRDQISAIFQQHVHALNLIHFNTKEPKLLYDQLMYAREIGGAHCHGFQLNMAWPDPEDLLRVQRENLMVIVLQVGARAFEMVGNSSERLADKIESEYFSLIDHVLLDASGGKGKPLDAEMLRPYLRALMANQLPIGLGVAGGLGSDSLDLIVSLADEFPDLSSDAENNLRDENDDLNVNAAIMYRNRADDLFGNRVR